MEVMQVIWVGRIVRMEGDCECGSNDGVVGMAGLVKVMQVIWLKRVMRIGICEGGSNDGGGVNGWIGEGDEVDMGCRRYC